MPDTILIIGTKSGVVISVTRISPFLTLSNSFRSLTITALPAPYPGLAPDPFIIISALEKSKLTFFVSTTPLQ